MVMKPILESASSELPVIPLDKLTAFMENVFSYYNELLSYHRLLGDALGSSLNPEASPNRTIADTVLDAILTWRDTYIKYAASLPVARFYVDEEIRNNTTFRDFHLVRYAHNLSRSLY
jgi:hypothetical protein